MTCERIDNSKIQKLWLDSIVSREKWNFDVSEKYNALWMSSTLEKQTFSIFSTQFSNQLCEVLFNHYSDHPVIFSSFVSCMHSLDIHKATEPLHFAVTRVADYYNHLHLMRGAYLFLCSFCTTMAKVS
jgi:hypothetical protein